MLLGDDFAVLALGRASHALTSTGLASRSSAHRGVHRSQRAERLHRSTLERSSRPEQGLPVGPASGRRRAGAGHGLLERLDLVRRGRRWKPWLVLRARAFLRLPRRPSAALFLWTGPWHCGRDILAGCVLGSVLPRPTVVCAAHDLAPPKAADTLETRGTAAARGTPTSHERWSRRTPATELARSRVRGAAQPRRACPDAAAAGSVSRRAPAGSPVRRQRSLRITGRPDRERDSAFRQSSGTGLPRERGQSRTAWRPPELARWRP
jgi:hypothetical protein